MAKLARAVDRIRSGGASTRRKGSFGDNALLKVRLPEWRTKMVLGALSLGFLALAGKVVYLQAFSTGFLQKQGEARYARTIDLPASRGKIVDRNGTVLASSLPASSVWVEPDQFAARSDQKIQLAKLLSLSSKELDAKLSDEDRSFVYLQRQVDASIAEQISSLGIRGIHRQREYKRYYPEGETMAHVVGFTNIEDRGQEGIELALNSNLSGQAGHRRVIKDNLGRVVEDVIPLREPVNGQDVQLSIDSKVQFHAFTALKEAVKQYNAESGAVVVLDVVTGEVLALANWPTYNPNQRSRLSGQQLRNRVMTDTFEPGSTMKPFTTALALETGRVKPWTMIQTAPGKMTIGSHTIHDSHAHGLLSVEEILQKSSNIGTAKMALQMAPKEMWDFYANLGLGQAPKLGFPGAAAGRIRPFKSWKPIEQATMSYGHGLSVSLIQLARAYSVFARDGELLPVSLIRQNQAAPGVRVVKVETARAVRKMLEMAAGPGGTAPKAYVQGYRVAGKTGTAHKQENGRYVNKYVSSFVGFAPVSSPRVVVAVMIDDPKGKIYFGGDVAAPIFSRITNDALRALRVAPDAPMLPLKTTDLGISDSPALLSLTRGPQQ